MFLFIYLFILRRDNTTLTNMSTKVYHVNVPDLAIQAHFEHWHVDGIKKKETEIKHKTWAQTRKVRQPLLQTMTADTWPVDCIWKHNAYDDN